MKDKMNELIEALQIFAKVKSVAENPFPTYCIHDELYVMAYPPDYSKEQLEQLKKLGFIPTEDETFVSYKFGSG